MELIRALGPPFVALLAVLAIDHLTSRRRLQPPAYGAVIAGSLARQTTGLMRRGLSLFVLWAVLWVGVFAPLGSLGQEQELDLSRLTSPQLFFLHLLLVLCLAVWYLLGFVRVSGQPHRASDRWSVQLGFRAPAVAREIGIGFVAGVAAWLAVLGVLLGVGVVLWWLGGEELLPEEPPPLVAWIAALPFWLRVGVSLSAGVVEETFFRGFLQPRAGVVLSTLLFVIAHVSYEQPLMLIGITLLSFIYAGLVRWRQNIWPAITAHVLFDTIQLLVVIPAALRLLPAGGEQGLPPVVAVLEVFGILGGRVIC